MLTWLLPATAAAHQQLLRATPAAGETLERAPGEIRLTFNQAVDVALARLRVVGPSGEIEIGALTVPADSPAVLLATISAPLPPGTYTVHWLVTGADGHPVRDHYSFEVMGAPAEETDTLGSSQSLGVIGQTAPGRAPPPAEHHAGAEAGGFDSGSPLYAAVRWLNFAGLLALIGAVCFALLLLPGVERRDPSLAPEVLDRARSRTAAVGLAASGVLLVALLLRFAAQSAALHGPGAGLVGELTGAMLTRTLWGWGWILQAAATGAALMGLWLARRGTRSGWLVAAVATLALAFTPALSGHAAATSALAVITDAAHVLAAGGWLGTLLVLVVVGLPVFAGGGQARSSAATLVSAFSPLALFFAAVVALTGLAAAWTHLPDLPALWGTGYGRTLLLKLAVLSGVFATGAYNWLRARPALARTGESGPIRRSATAELTLGVLVLAVTAVLVATPPPAEDVEEHATEVVTQ